MPRLQGQIMIRYDKRHNSMTLYLRIVLSTPILSDLNNFCTTVTLNNYLHTPLYLKYDCMTHPYLAKASGSGSLKTCRDLLQLCDVVDEKYILTHCCA